MLVLRDDTKREYVCGPERGMRATKVGRQEAGRNEALLALAELKA